jgi:hypothetical protein
MAENVIARDLVAPVADEAAPTTFSDLPDDLKFSVFEVRIQDDPTWVRETFPLINRACSVVFLTPQASPLHATVLVDLAPRDSGGGLARALSVVASDSWERKQGCARQQQLLERLQESNPNVSISGLSDG